MCSIELEIDEKAKLSLDLLWLRDHCRCDLCYDYVHSSRKVNVLDIPDDIAMKSHKVENKQLSVIWNDDHQSNYDFEFLKKFQLKVKNPLAFHLWNKESFTDAVESSCRFKMQDYVSDVEVQKQVLKSLHVLGVAFIDGSEPTQDCTEVVIRKLFPVHKNFFGEMWTFSKAQKDSHISEYTNDYLGPHNDNAYFYDAAGLQVLQCINHTGTGGEYLLIDGFQVAYKIRHEKNPKVFERLTKTVVGVEFKEGDRHFKHMAPIINLDPVTNEVMQVRYNMNDRVPFDTKPSDHIREFYNDFKIISREFADENNQIVFKLRPGTIMIYDNWRLLHGQLAYTGSRSMTGCYVSRDEYQSALRVNGFIE